MRNRDLGSLYFQKRFEQYFDGMCASDLDAATAWLPKDGKLYAMVIDEIPMLLVGIPEGTIAMTESEVLLNGFPNLDHEFSEMFTVGVIIGWNLEDLLGIARMSNQYPLMYRASMHQLMLHINAAKEQFDYNDFKSPPRIIIKPL